MIYIFIYFLDTLTSSLVPLIPFPIPPKCEPTLEIEQFPTSIASNCSPYTTYVNHLYVFPKSLKYENQKAFTKVSVFFLFIYLFFVCLNPLIIAHDIITGKLHVK